MKHLTKTKTKNVIEKNTYTKENLKNMSKKNIQKLSKMLVKNNDTFGGSTKNPPSSVSVATSPLQSLPPSYSDKTQLLGRTEKRSQCLLSRTFLQPPFSSTTTPSSIPTKTPTLKTKLLPSLTTALPYIAVNSTISNNCSSSSNLVSKSLPSTRIISPSLVTSTVAQTRTSTTSTAISGAGSSGRSTADQISAATASILLSGRTKILQQRSRHHPLQQRQRHQQYTHLHHTPQFHFRIFPGLKATSFFTILTLVCLETVLLSTVSNCAKTFYMHWNTSNSIFRIDNTDHIIDVNKGNLAFEFDQVHIICPVYEPGTYENETEKYIIYNVSKVEYETCRITNADPRVIAICDKPQRLMFFTITFRPFTPQPGGLEFLPGNDYYFISTSSKDDLYRRIGGRCSTNNMKVVFKVCCAPEDKNNRTNGNMANGNGSSGIGGIGGMNNNGVNHGNGGNINGNTAIQQQHNNNININGGSQMPLPKLPGLGGGGVGGIGIGINNAGTGNNGGQIINGNSGTSINTNIDQYNRIPMQQPNSIGIGTSNGNIGMNGIGGIGGSISGSGINGINGQHPTGIRINNVPSSQQHPSQKNDDYDKHPNEVVKNEELTYNSAASSIYKMRRRWSSSEYVNDESSSTIQFTKRQLDEGSWRFKTISPYKSVYQKFKTLLQLLLFTSNHRYRINIINTFVNFISNCNPIILTTTVLVTLVNLFQYKLSPSWSVMRLCKSSSKSSLSTLTPSSSSSSKSTTTLSVSSKVPRRTRTSSTKLAPEYSSSSPPKNILFSPVACCIVEALR